MMFGLRTTFLRAAGIMFVTVFAHMVASSSATIRPDYALAALISLGAVLTFGEITILTAMSMLLLSSRPDGGVVLLVFLALPLIFHAARRFMPWQSWFTNVLFLVLGAVLFYLVTVHQAFILAPLTVFIVVVLDVVVGMAIYSIMRYKTAPRQVAI